MMKLLPPEELFGEILSTVARARTLLAEGEFIELKSLDEDVLRVCEAVQGLSREDAKEYLPELQFLLGEVEALSADMKLLQAGIQKELKDSSVTQRANHAYAQGSILREGKE